MNAQVITRRAVLYGRVSHLARGDRERGDAKSVEQQLEALNRIAQRENVTVVAQFRDDGISASAFARGKVREGWQSTMDSIMSGTVTELWIWEQSRATRDRPVWAALFGACAAQDVKITINGRVHDPNDPDDAFALDIGAALATKESAQTSKRIKRDVEARAAKGLPHGRIPYGYRRIYDPNTRALIRQEPDPATAEIVRELARRVLAGEALYRLSIEMNARGVPSPETVRKRRNGDDSVSWAWRPDQVRDVVASPAAAGLRAHRGAVLDGVTAAWEPIVSRADHEAITDKFSDPKRRSWVDASAKHLLTGLARCGECGGEIRRIKNRGIASYACVGKRHGHDGSPRFCVSRKIDWVDTFVADVMVERLSRPDLLDAFVRDDGDDVQAAQAVAASLRSELAQMREAKKAGRISLESFMDFEPDLLSRLADAERRGRPTQVPQPIADIAGGQAAHRWDALELEQKREVIRLLGVVKIWKTKMRARRFDTSSVSIEWHHPLPSDADH